MDQCHPHDDDLCTGLHPLPPSAAVAPLLPVLPELAKDELFTQRTQRLRQAQRTPDAVCHPGADRTVVRRRDVHGCPRLTLRRRELAWVGAEEMRRYFWLP